MLSKWHTQSHYIYIYMQIAGIYHFQQKSSSISVSCPIRHGPAISLQVRVDIHVKKKQFPSWSTVPYSLMIISKICWFSLLQLWIPTLNNGKDIQRTWELSRVCFMWMQIARNLPFSGKIFLYLCFLPYQTWPCDIVASSGRHTCEKKNSFHREVPFHTHWSSQKYVDYRYFSRESQH